MDRVSNVDFNEVSGSLGLTSKKVRSSSRFQGEFGRFKITWEAARIKLPTKRELEKKAAQITKLVNQPRTEVCAALCIICLRAQQ
jgi:hypothetical protein